MPTVVNLVDPHMVPTVLPPDALCQLTAAGWTVVGRPWPRGAGLARVADWIGRDASAVLATWGVPAFTPEVHAALPNLRFIGYCAGSVKRVVTPATFAHGVVVASAAPVIARAVGEYCLAAVLWHLRGLDTMTRQLRGGDAAPQWRRPASARSLYGRSVGIVSASGAARCFIELLRPFGCEVLVYDPFLLDPAALGVRTAPLEEVFSQTVVSVHAPDLPETRGLIDGALLRRIPDGGLLINSARPADMDYDALAAELRHGRFHAVLDVFPQEPLPRDSALYGVDNVTLSPHTAGFSVDIYAAIGREMVADLLRWERGEPVRLAVDAARWPLLA